MAFGSGRGTSASGGSAAPAWYLLVLVGLHRHQQGGLAAPGYGARHYLCVWDDAAGTVGAREVLIAGFETMTDVDNGTAPHPATAQSALASNSLVARKSATADATDRPWLVAADAASLYVFILSGHSAGVSRAFSIADFASLIPGAPGARSSSGAPAGTAVPIPGKPSGHQRPQRGHGGALRGQEPGGSSSWPVGKHADVAGLPGPDGKQPTVNLAATPSLTEAAIESSR